MTLVNTPTTANKYIEPSMAAKKTYIFARNPLNGGTPALLNMIAVKVNAINGLMRDMADKSVKNTARPPFCFSVDKTKVQALKTRITYKIEYNNKACTPSMVPVANPTSM